MKTFFSVVEIIDVEPFQAGDGDLFRIRLEVLRELDADVYSGRVYRLETYRLQPAFPQAEHAPPNWKNDALIYVVDDMFDINALYGGSAQEVRGKFQAMLDGLFERGGGG